MPATVEPVPLTAGRPLRTVRTTLDQLPELAASLDDAYVRVILDEPARTGIAADVREHLPDAVEITVAAHEEEDRQAETWDTASFHRSPDEVFGEYLEAQQIEDDELRRLFRELLEDALATDTA